MQSSKNSVYRQLVAPVVATVALSLSTAAVAADLGPATDYNLFSLGDVKLTGTDVEGKVAIAGNANLTSFAAGMTLDPNANNGDTLIVGQNLSFTNGSVNGNAVYGGTATVSGVTFNNGELRQGNPINFSQAGNQLRSISSSLSNLTATADTKIGEFDKGITLKGTNSSLNVFNLAGTDLGQATSLTIDAPDDSTVVVNVGGENVSFRNLGFTLNGKDTNYWHQLGRQNVIYNFYQAKNLQAQGIGFVGSFLAPNADFKYDNGAINGNVIVNSLEGTGQINRALFKGRVPSEPTPPAKEIPEPSTALSLGLIATITMFLRRQTQTAA